MRLLPLLLGVGLLAGCTISEPPPPPLVPPPPEDLSTWAVPELVTPPVPPVVRIAQKDAPPTPAEKVYTYAPGATYPVPVGIGFPLDIAFGRGEQIHSITDGDRAPQTDNQTRRWQVVQGLEGSGPDQRQHLFVTVTEPGLRNGLTITTTKRAYYVTLESVRSTPIRVLRWQQPPELVDMPAIPEPTPGPLPPLDTPTRYHVGYVLESNHPQPPEWLPKVYDDGRKMYLLYPEVTLFTSVPLVRLVTQSGPALVNARQFLSVVILDQLAPQLELREGIGENAVIVTIRRGRLRTITCPGDEQCPHWPDAAYTLARRQP